MPITVKDNFERKNADKFKAHLKELADDKARRVSDSNKEIAHMSRDAARFAVRRARGRVVIGFGRFGK